MVSSGAAPGPGRAGRDVGTDRNGRQDAGQVGARAELTDLSEQVARAIGAAQDELRPVRRRHQPRLRPEETYGRAVAAALAVVRRSIEGMEPVSYTHLTLPTKRIV